MAPESPSLLSLPPGLEPDAGVLLDRFIAWVEARGLELYPAQEEAILALFDGRNVILNTPTGSGKSLVATALHYHALAGGRRSVYTCPIKALVNEKFLALCRDFGPDQVGMSTGDATVNHGAPILCCTAEVLANMALRSGPRAEVQDVIMDEFHYYSDRERGSAWQIPLLTLPHARFLLMSATLGSAAPFISRLDALTGRETVLVQSEQRPVPLEFSYEEVPLERTVQNLLSDGRAPIYVVHFTQRDCAQNAQAFTSIQICTREERAGLAAELEKVKFASPYGQEMKRLLRHGIGLHHAGLLPKYRILVEQLAQRGLLKIICGTDTLGVGVNVPIRTVLLTRLCKYDGEKSRILSVRDFHQICGRAGRKGFDDRGWVVAQAPEHVIENLRLAEKSGGDPAKKRKQVKRKPPEKGYVSWSRETYERLRTSAPEPLSSSFRVSHGMLLNVLAREDGSGCRAMKRLLDGCHEPPQSKRQLRARAVQLFRSLVERRIVELRPRGGSGPPVRVNVELQEDFSLHQTLSLFLIDALGMLDRDSPDYPLDLLSLVEAIVENPDIVLKRQLDRAKSEKLAELKAAGMEYERRMEELDKVEYPKPNRELIYPAFNAFAAQHPWVGEENIQPKSIAREMFERFLGFSGYVRDYELQRVEGVLLRYLAQVYKTLAQTVPDQAKTAEVDEIEAYFKTLLRDVDSSLLDEWERLRNPEYVAPDRAAATPAPAPDITRDARRFEAEIRGSLHRLVGALARGDYADLIELLTPQHDEQGAGWTAERLKGEMEAFFRDRSRLRLDPEARRRENTVIAERETDRWRVQQMLLDPEEHNDWLVEVLVNLAASREAATPVVQLVRIGPL